MNQWSFETLLDFVDEPRVRTRDYLQRDLLKITDHKWYKYKSVGLTDDESDTLAIQIGCHPCQIWGQEWFAHSLSEWDEPAL